MSVLWFGGLALFQLLSSLTKRVRGAPEPEPEVGYDPNTENDSSLGRAQHSWDGWDEEEIEHELGAFDETDELFMVDEEEEPEPEPEEPEPEEDEPEPSAAPSPGPAATTPPASVLRGPPPTLYNPSTVPAEGAGRRVARGPSEGSRPARAGQGTASLPRPRR